MFKRREAREIADRYLRAYQAESHALRIAELLPIAGWAIAILQLALSLYAASRAPEGIMWAVLFGAMLSAGLTLLVWYAVGMGFGLLGRLLGVHTDAVVAASPLLEEDEKRALIAGHRAEIGTGG
jgi:hypothetical protein